VIFSVTVPLVMPGAFAGGAMVFLLTMKELPATLILSPIGYRTLSSSIWSASSEAFFAKTAAAALLLVLVAGIPTAYLTLRGYGDQSGFSARLPGSARTAQAPGFNGGRR
jgi:iron(III) transport system permease protein